MKHSQVNHLRRLLAWVRCELTGQTPEEVMETIREISPAFPNPTDHQKQVLLKMHDDAKHVPQYVRDAMKALEPLVRDSGTVVDGEIAQRKLPAKPFPLVHKES